MNKHKTLGYIIAGSLSEGLVMRVSADVESSYMQTGIFVCVPAAREKLFCMITDIRLHASQPDLLSSAHGASQTYESVVAARTCYVTASLKPLIAITKNGAIKRAVIIPRHFTAVHAATAEDMHALFGKEADSKKSFFAIGNPLNMNAQVCLDLAKLVERSTGIFGKTGTGKTFVTRLLLAGLLKHRAAVNLVFDMHSEYGLQARKEGSGLSFVKGLKTLFPDQVAIFSLDPIATRRRGAQPDVTIQIPYEAITVADITSLAQELNLHPTAVEASYLIASKYKKRWLQALLESGDDLKGLALQVGAHPESVSALYRKLKRVERYNFIVPKHPTGPDVITTLMEHIQRGISVIIEFGNHTSSFCYLLIANIITRRIHDLYIKQTEKYLGSQRIEDKPHQLIITIEEAHKFLNSNAARQTIFGTIAREMRKYYVSLLIVDQRPSGIDQEVLSQLGTKIVAQLSDEKDIQAVLTGVAGAADIKTVLTYLETKKQALVLGHAVPMPVMIQTREYGPDFYHAMAPVQSEPVTQLVESIYQ